MNQGNKVSFVTGGADKELRHWTLDEGNDSKFSCVPIGSHTDWVRDVCYLSADKSVASCGEDRKVRFWKVKDWIEQEHSLEFDNPVWRVSSSEEGSYLAVTEGNNNTVIFTKSKNGWEQIAKSTAEGTVEPVKN